MISVPLFVLVGWPEAGHVLKQVVAFGGAILAMSILIDLVTIDARGLRQAIRSRAHASNRLARRHAGHVLRRIGVVGVLLLITKLVYRVPRLDLTPDVLWYTAFVVIGVIGAALVWSSYHRPPYTPKALP